MILAYHSAVRRASDSESQAGSTAGTASGSHDSMSLISALDVGRQGRAECELGQGWPLQFKLPTRSTVTVTVSTAV